MLAALGDGGSDPGSAGPHPTAAAAAAIQRAAIRRRVGASDRLSRCHGERSTSPRPVPLPRLALASAVMPSKPVFLVSDVHLGAVPPTTEAAFRSWLLHVKESASRLVVNGDLFDFWFEYGSVVPGEHVRVLALLAELVEAGVPVLVMGGNHDWWGGEFLRNRIGVEFHQDPVRLRLAGRRVLLAHGDGLGRGDLGYRFLRLVLRGRVTRRLFRWVHPDVGAWAARAVSGTRSQLKRGPRPGPGRRAAFLARWAASRLEENPELEIVAMGHTHAPVVTEVAPDRYYVNSGDWVFHRSYVVIAETGAPELREWQG